MSYFAAKEIRDKLAGSADKSLFGTLKGSAGSWDKIVKLYEKQSTQTISPNQYRQCAHFTTVYMQTLQLSTAGEPVGQQ